MVLDRPKQRELGVAAACARAIGSAMTRQRPAAAVDARAYDAAIETLDALLSIGKQADPVEVDLIAQRAAKVPAVA